MREECLRDGECEQYSARETLYNLKVSIILLYMLNQIERVHLISKCSRMEFSYRRRVGLFAFNYYKD